MKKMGIELTWEEENGHELTRLADHQALMRSSLPLETALEQDEFEYEDTKGMWSVPEVESPLVFHLGV